MGARLVFMRQGLRTAVFQASRRSRPVYSDIAAAGTGLVKNNTRGLGSRACRESYPFSFDPLLHVSRGPCQSTAWGRAERHWGASAGHPWPVEVRGTSTGRLPAFRLCQMISSLESVLSSVLLPFCPFCIEQSGATRPTDKTAIASSPALHGPHQPYKGLARCASS
jgi:hypothetical protein